MATKLTTSSSESSLSPPPEDVAAQTETVTVTTKAMKRQASTGSNAKVTKRVKTKKDMKGQAGPGSSTTPRPKRRAPNQATVEDVADEEFKAEVDGDVKTKVTKKTTTRKKKDENLAPLEERTTDTPLWIGAHVSTAGGVPNALINIVHIGGNAFAMFFKNQRKWDSAPLEDETVTVFVDNCKKHGFDVGKCCLPHGSYLVNLAHPDADRKKQAYDAFLDDLSRCRRLGIKLYNFHPGNSNATTREDGIRIIAENINQAHQDPASGSVVAVLETMATQGNTIGGTFIDLKEIIDLVTDKSRVGVCLDTCHVFAAGYDLRTPEAYAETMATFDKEIGLQYLKALHINDSKAPFGSNRDMHANIGTGHLGLRAFHNIVNDERLHGLPMILETPIDVVDAAGKKSEDKGIWAREIKMLESLVGMDVDSAEFEELEASLQEEGEEVRKQTADAFDRKQAKAAKTRAANAMKAKAKTAEAETEGAEDAKPKRTLRKRKAKQVETEDEDEDMEE